MLSVVAGMIAEALLVCSSFVGSPIIIMLQESLQTSRMRS